MEDWSSPWADADDARTRHSADRARPLTEPEKTPNAVDAEAVPMKDNVWALNNTSAWTDLSKADEPGWGEEPEIESTKVVEDEEKPPEKKVLEPSNPSGGGLWPPTSLPAFGPPSPYAAWREEAGWGDAGGPGNDGAGKMDTVQPAPPVGPYPEPSPVRSRPTTPAKDDKHDTQSKEIEPGAPAVKRDDAQPPNHTSADRTLTPETKDRGDEAQPQAERDDSTRTAGNDESVEQPSGTGQDEDDKDDFGDFADFAETAEEEDIDAPQSIKPDPTARTILEVTPFNINAEELVPKLFPIPTSYPEPPPVEAEIIHTTGARKAWYKLTQTNTLRQTKMANDDDYVRVTWQGSRIKAEVTKIVSRWILEDQLTGRRGGLKAAQTPSAMFGWARGATEEDDAKKRLSLGPERGKRPAAVHTRHTSEALTKTQTSKSTASPPLAVAFGWNDRSDAKPPVAEPKDSSAQPTASPPPKMPAAPPAPTKQPPPLSPTQKSLPTTPLSSPRAPETPVYHHHHSSAIPPIKPTSPPQERSDDAWGAFENMLSAESPKETTSPPQNAPKPPTAMEELDFSVFESAPPVPTKSTTAPSPAPTKPLQTNLLPKEPNGLGVSASNLAAVSTETVTPTTQKSTSSANSLTPQISTNPQRPVPNAGDTCNGQTEEQDDEWGEMVESTEDFGEPMSAPVIPSSTPLGTINGAAYPPSNGKSNAPAPSWASTISPQPSASKPVTSSTSAPLANFALFTSAPAPAPAPDPLAAAAAAPTKPNDSFLDEFDSFTSAPATVASQPDSSGWDLSFFETRAPTTSTKSSQPPPKLTTHQRQPRPNSDIWDTPPPLLEQKQKVETEDDRVVRRILEGLPDLRYMLPPK